MPADRSTTHSPGSVAAAPPDGGGCARPARPSRVELDVHSEQVATENPHVDSIPCPQRVPGNDVALASEGIIAGAQGGDTGYPAVAQSNAQPYPYSGVVGCCARSRPGTCSAMIQNPSPLRPLPTGTWRVLPEMCPRVSRIARPAG